MKQHVRGLAEEIATGSVLNHAGEDVKERVLDVVRAIANSHLEGK